MRKFQCLRLLLVKDFRTTIRRWGSLIVDAILFAILIAFCYWLMKEIGHKKAEKKSTEEKLANLDDVVVIKWPKKLDYTDRKRVEISMNENFCPNLKIDRKGGEDKPGVTLHVTKYDKTGVEYDIQVISEKSLVNTKEMYPNIYGVWNDFQSSQPINSVKTAYLSQLCFNLAFANITKQKIPPLEAMVMPETVKPSPFTYLGPFFIFIMLIMAVLLIREVCIEKEIGIHTYMVTMGLPRFTFYLSHLVFALAKFYIFLAVTLGLAIWLKGMNGLYFVICVFLFTNVVIAWMIMSAVLCYRSIYAILLVTAPILIMFAIHLAFIGQQVLFNSMMASIYCAVNPVTAFMLLLYHMDFTIGISEKFHLIDNFEYYLPMAIPGGILILQSIILLLLAFYFDYVLPLDNLPKEHPFFFLGFGKKKAKKPDADADDTEPETETKVPRDQLNIIELTKRWSNGDYGVNKATFSAKIGECTALLGHNGAGKSTVFGCLTGFLKPTSGTIEFPENEDCEEDRRVGYCPQWNPLFPKLTVKEHLALYCELLTGFEPTKENVKNLIIELQLYEARNTRSENLSGGMKRKLSLGIALISDAKVVLLDEPTSGMDMVARKNTFKMIAKAKQTHAVILTTHYMDEADKLADAVVVMVRGHVVAKGSPGHLKGKFGVAVVLVVYFDFPYTVDRDVLVAAIKAVMFVVQKHCPLAVLDSPIAGQVDILLTSANRREFTFLFAELEERKEELHIQSFNCKMNTLDQVFIKITDKTENVKDRADPSQLIREFISCRRNVSTGAGLFFHQFHGLAMRKWQNTRRDYIQPFLLLLCIFLAAAAMAYFHFKRKGAATDSDFMEESLALADYQHMSISLYGHDKIGLQSNLKKIANKHEYVEVKLPANNTRIQILQDKRFLLPPRGLAYFFETYPNVTMYFNKGFPNGPYFGIDAYFQALIPNKIKTNLALKIIAVKDKKNVLKESGNSLNPSLVALMVMCLVFPVIFAVPGFLYADERFAGAIHLYKRTRLSYFVYWFVGFLTDAFMCGIVIAIIMGFIYIFDGYSHYLLLVLFVVPVLLLLPC
uniref:ABC transporter domain-containing protein n=1 Tax=Panagrellus redivivus TaxID=6233 RepID=A0A7E4V2Y6_PANRE